MTAAPPEGFHECPAPRCDIDVAFNILACGKHWRQLPRDIQTRVLRAWREGDVAGHAAARQEAVDWWESRP